MKTLSSIKTGALAGGFALTFLAQSAHAQTPLYTYSGTLGPGQSVSVTGPSVDLPGPRTITAWVDVPVNSDYLGQPIATGGVPEAGDFFGVGGTGGENWSVPQYSLYVDHWGYQDFSSAETITPGQNTFVAMVDNPDGSIDFYINGANAGIFGTPGNLGLYDYNLTTYTIAGNTTIGSTTDLSNLGDVSDVSIYGLALTGDQIEGLYNGSVPDAASPITLAMAGTFLGMFGRHARRLLAK